MQTLPFQNVFVLCTGRCGSTTFDRACRHMTNWTAGHETRSHLTGPDRFAYPPRHIEADNRLSWMLGRLEQAYGADAAYVHLTRDAEAVAVFAEQPRALLGSAHVKAGELIPTRLLSPPEVSESLLQQKFS